MTQFDCKSMHHKCKAKCCSYCPIPKSIWNDNQDKIVTEPSEIIQILEDENSVVPITKTGSCVFLNKDLSCNIYENRPEICRRFGDESHPMLFCHYLNKEGKERCRQDKRRVERQSQKYLTKLKII